MLRCKFLLSAAFLALLSGCQSDQTPADRLVSLIERNNVPVVLDSETAGAINAPASDGLTPLYHAVSDRFVNRETIKRLIRNGANPFVRVDKINSYPIRRARRNKEVFRILACSQFDINTRFESVDPKNSIYRHYPNILFDAVIVGDVESVRTILDCGGNTEIRDYQGKTPLLRAALVNDYDMVFLLLRNGADATVRDKNGNDFCSLWRISRGLRQPEKEREVGTMLSKRGLQCKGA